MPAPERVALQKSSTTGRLGRPPLCRGPHRGAPPFWTVGRVLEHLQTTPDLPESFFEVFVVDPGHGSSATSSSTASCAASVKPRSTPSWCRTAARVDVMDESEEVGLVFQRYNLVSAPVVDEAGRLVGVITIDDVVDVLQDEADEEIKALGGVRGDEELSDDVWFITRSRFGWLFVNLLTAFLASAVLGLFEGELQKMVALAVLAPIVASQGGNAATQTMTVAVRALAVRDLGPKNALRVTSREATVGLLNGIGFGLLTGIVASLWFGDWNLGVVIGLAMVVNLVAGALGGILISARAGEVRRGPGRLLGRVRDDGHRRRRLLLIPRHRLAVVRARLSARAGRFAGRLERDLSGLLTRRVPSKAAE